MGKRYYWQKISAVMLLIGAVAAPLIGFAADFRVGEQPGVQMGEQVNGDVYITGGSATVAGTVAGDAFAAGGTVVMSGNIGSDAMAAGGNVTITSAVGDDVRAAGGNIVIQGTVGGDVLAAGGQVNISAPRVGGDIAIAGGMVRIDAPVAGGARIAGGEVYINAPIAGDVEVQADKLTLGSRAAIEGSLTYKSPKELTREDGAVVRGQVSYEPRTQKERHARRAIWGVLSVWFLIKFVMLLVASLIVSWIFGRLANVLATRVNARPWPELGKGLITMIVLPIASILLMVTVIGIPFGVLGIISFVALMLFSWMLVPVVVGAVVYRWVTKEKEHNVSWKTILTGAVVYTVLGLIPFVGWIAQCVLSLITLGTLVSIKWEAVKEWR